MSDADRERDELGLGLAPGDAHYRAFVGPPEDYDLVAAMTFGLLTALGLRQHHRLLDIGCGSLRIGRLLIPYLNRARYVGLEPNRWLVEAGIANETGADQIAIKAARFVYAASPASVDADARFDFALAQSIFSHAGLDVVGEWLDAMPRLLVETGALVATFLDAEEDFTGSGWVYPDCVAYRRDTLETLARDRDLAFRVLDWRHPRQTWALFARPGFDVAGLEAGGLGWNASLDTGRW
jgi:cyclopropane fatty-acyl-phospholipid synthase-like methyltransferase